MKRLEKPDKEISRTERLRQIVEERGFFGGDGWQHKGKTVRMWPSLHKNDDDVELIFDVLSEELERRQERGY